MVRLLLLASLLYAAGCQQGDSLLAEVRALPQRIFSGQKSCRYGDPTGCPPERMCAYVEKDRSECVPRYVGTTPLVRFPFDPSHVVECVQGPETPGPGSAYAHNSVSTLYAIDLATPKAEDDEFAPKKTVIRSGEESEEEAPAQGEVSKAHLPGTVYTSMEGTALVYRSCKDYSVGAPAGSAGDDCGEGFGNHVRILNPNGYLLLYAQLSQIFVEDGQVVKAGDAIGREGRSGRAKQRHLHFSVHFAPITSWLETLSFYRSHPGAVPPSIPFETTYCDPFITRECLRHRSRMDQLPCNAKEHVPLRADWRD